MKKILALAAAALLTIPALADEGMPDEEILYDLPV